MSIEEALEHRSDAAPRTRFDAITALGHHADQSDLEQVIPALIEALSADDSPRVRFAAASALSEAIPTFWTREAAATHTELLTDAATALMGALDDEAVGVRGQAAATLGDLDTGDPTTEARIVDAVVGVLDDESAQVRENAVRALSREYGEPDAEQFGRVVDALVDRLFDEDADVSMRAESTLESITENGPGARETVVGALLTRATDDGTDPSTRATAVDTLSSVQTHVSVRVDDLSPFEERLDDLVTLLHDEEAVRSEAIPLFRGLAKDDDTMAVDVVTDCLAAGDPQVRARTLEALGALSRGSPEVAARVADAVETALEDSDGSVRRTAVDALVPVGNTTTELGERAIRSVSAKLEDPDEDVREAAVRALESLGTTGVTDERDPELGIAAIDALSTHDDEEAAVRLEATETIESLGTQPSHRIEEDTVRADIRERTAASLGERLEDPEPEVREAAARGLEEVLESEPSLATAVPLSRMLAVRERADIDTGFWLGMALETVAREAPHVFEGIDTEPEDVLE